MTHQCSICLKRFQFASKLQRHHLTHTGHRPFSCLLCGKAFRQAAHLKTHQETHAKQTPLTGETQLTSDCGESLSTTSLFHRVQEGSALFPGSSSQSCERKHVAQAAEQVTVAIVKQPELPWNSAVDWKLSDSIPQKHVLQEQQFNSVEPPEGKVHQCNVCQKWFASILQLHKHSLSHSQQKRPETVKQKAKVWLGAAVLSVDSVDSGSAPDKKFPLSCSKGKVKHQCPECPKSFSSPSKLRRHCLIHTGQRPFSCFECGGTFRQLAHLKTHQQTHRKSGRCHERFCEQVGESSQNIETQVEIVGQPEVTDSKPTFNTSSQPGEQDQMNSHFSHSNQCKLVVPQAPPFLPKNLENEVDLVTLPLTTEIKMEGVQGSAKVDVQESKTRDCYLTDIARGPFQGKKYDLDSAHPARLRKHQNKQKNKREIHGANQHENAKSSPPTSNDLYPQEETLDNPDHMQTVSSPDDVAALAMQLELNIMVKSETLDNHSEVSTAQPEGSVVTKQRGRKYGTEKAKSSHQCIMCLRHFPAPSKLRRHILVHTGQRPFGCDVCGKRFRQLTHVKLHVRTHASSQCSQLRNSSPVFFPESKVNSTALFTAADLNAPSDSPTPERLRPECHLEMSVAEKKGSIESDLVIDGVFQTIIGKSHRRHQCTFCSKFFTSPYKLKRHILIHTGQKPYRCLCCGKTFRQAVHLKVHQQTHGRFRLFKGALQQKFLNLLRSTTRGCTHSRNVISQGQGALVIPSGSLLSHVELGHTSGQSGELSMANTTTAGRQISEKIRDSFVNCKNTCSKTRAYECPFCLKCFSAPSKLARHNLIHTGQRPFQCPICHRAFRQSSHLKAHHSVHVRMRPVHQRQAIRWRGSGTNEAPGNNAAVEVREARFSDCGIPAPPNPNIRTEAEEVTAENELHKTLDKGEGTISRGIYRYSCERRLDSPYKFQRHYLTHTSHKPFSCHCGRKFRLSIHLRRHQQSHIRQPSTVPPAESRSPNKPHIFSCSDFSQEGAHTNFSLPEYGLSYGKNLETENTQFCKQSFTIQKCELDGVGLAVTDHALSDRGTVEDGPAEALPSVTRSPVSKHGCSVDGADGDSWVASTPYFSSSLSHHGTTQAPSRFNPSEFSVLKCKKTRDYQCIVCQKNFDSPSKLSRHFLIHTGMKPFQCSVCGKAFRQLCHLRTHQHIHRRARRSTSWRAGAGNVQDHLVSPFPDSRSVGEMALPGSIVTLENKGDHTMLSCHTSEPQEPNNCFSLGGQNEKSLFLTAQDCELNSVGLVGQNYEMVNGIALDGGHVEMESPTMQYPAEKPREIVQSAPPKWSQQASITSDPPYFSTPYMVKVSEIPSVDMASLGGKTTQVQHSDCTVQSCEHDSDTCSVVNCQNLVGNLSTTSAGMAVPISHTVDENLSQRKMRHKCSDCQRCFSSPSKLKRHYLIHAGEKPFKCSICAKAFRQAVHLKFHQRVHAPRSAHSGVFQYEATDCKARGQDIWQPFDLEPRRNSAPESTAHEDIVEEEAPVASEGGWCEPLSETFSCETCSLTFFTETELQLHDCARKSGVCSRSSSSYQCAVCFKNFEAPSKLKRHYVIHTGQRPFQCSVCGKTFTQSGHLKTHQLIHK